MGEEIQMPRSGVWHLRSKKDPRWNHTGQYSALLGDPPLATPAEGQAAIQELQSSLAESPPDDLQLVSLPYPRPALKKLFDFHAFAVTERQVALHHLTGTGGLSEMNLNMNEALLSLGKPGQSPLYRLPAQFLGMLAQDRSWWQWGWAREEKLPFGRAALSSVHAVREYGTQHEIPELTYAEIALGIEGDRPWFNGDYLAMVSTHICRADFYVALPATDDRLLWMYWLISAPDVPPYPTSESRQFASGIAQAMVPWASALEGSAGRDLVRAYAEQKQCRISEVGDRRLRVDASSGGHLFVDFDESGAIAGIELPEERPPVPKKDSWLGRLFRR
jgi:hypothetical protein